MGMYSKFWGSLIGGIVGLLVSKFGLPAEWASPEYVAAITLLASGVATYLFPANKAS